MQLLVLPGSIGMVFQSFNLFSHLNVLDNLIYAPVNVLGMKQPTAVAKAEKLLEQFGLKLPCSILEINIEPFV